MKNFFHNFFNFSKKYLFIGFCIGCLIGYFQSENHNKFLLIDQYKQNQLDFSSLSPFLESDYFNSPEFDFDFDYSNFPESDFDYFNSPKKAAKTQID